MAACERDMVALLLEHLQLQMQSGHTEQAIACVQALIEFNCFSPDFPGRLRPTCHQLMLCAAPAALHSLKCSASEGALKGRLRHHPGVCSLLCRHLHQAEGLQGSVDGRRSADR